MQTLKDKSLFWDVDLATLDQDKHREYIIERILAKGDMPDVAWARETYGDATIKKVIKERAYRLDAKSLNFWCWYFHVDKKTCTLTRSPKTPK